MSEFIKFKDAVEKQFKEMSKHTLFKMDVDKNKVWDTYLESFPEGTNNMYVTRREYDCQCCKNFIRNIGNVVAIIDGEVVSVWDITVDNYFQIVADALSKLVKNSKIDNKFLTSESTAGVDKNFYQTVSGIGTWHHLFAHMPTSCMISKAALGTKLGENKTSNGVFFRSLSELSVDSVEIVLELIGQNSLYRGADYKASLELFLHTKLEFDKLKDDKAKDIFCWTKSSALPPAVTHIRNTAIGSLLVDLSEGRELEYAVKSFESKVAPTNYKRPTALVTKGMIESAQKKIQELGLESALERRYATINDITINNILFADRTAKEVMTGGIFESMKPTKPQTISDVAEVSIDTFLQEILPKASSVEVLVENSHLNNMVSLIAPQHADAKGLFKWDNGFSWSYNGDVADSIKERVKQAGGSVEGDLCCRLAWDYTDDLDFHMYEPGGGHIYFSSRSQQSPCGGRLDVDANGGSGMMANPVENIFYSDKRVMKEGIYTLEVNNYSKRSDGVGFEVEIEFEGQILSISYDKALRTGSTVEVARIEYSKKGGFKILKSLPSKSVSKTAWGISTQAFHKVSVAMLSPNYWDDKAVGNKHYFFMLEGCKNEGKARPFFNEFLSDDLSAHRKVLEVAGAKMKTEESEAQLTGLGFSSTQRGNVTCRVSGSFNRVVKVVF